MLVVAEVESLSSRPPFVCTTVSATVSTKTAICNAIVCHIGFFLSEDPVVLGPVQVEVRAMPQLGPLPDPVFS